MLSWIGCPHPGGRPYSGTLRARSKSTVGHGTVPLSAGIAFALLLSFSIPVFSAFAAADTPRILMIHSYNSNSNWTTEIEKGVREALSEQYGPVSFQLEFMDTRHYSGADYHDRLKSLLTYKLQGRSFDIVLTSDNDAFAFVRANRTQLFSTVPVVFCGINNFTRSMLAGVSGMTGIAEDVSVRETLDIALELHPGLKRIVVIGLTTIPADKANREAFVEQVRTGYGRLKFDFWDAVDTDELANRLPLLGPDTIVVINGIIAEPDGRMLGFAETTTFIRARSSVPLYTLWDVFHHGTLGGKMVTGRMQGRLAGSLAARILKGEDPDKIPVVHSTSANQYFFDLNELSRFRISEDRLPVDSVITNKPSPFYVVSKTYLRTGIAAFLLLACIVVLLAVTIAARKKAEKSLIEGQRWQKALFDNITDFVWMKDREGRVLACNESFRLAFRWEPGAVLGKTDYDLFPSSVADRMRKDDEDVIASRVRGHLEESLEMPGGEMKWFETIKTPVFDKSGRVMGTVGSARDITERKRTEAALARSQNKLKRIIEDSPIPICWADEECRVEFVNQAFVDLFGYRMEDIPTAEEWFRRAYPDEPFRKEAEARWRARIAAARSEGTEMRSTECNVTCKDGSVRTVEIMNTLLEDAILAVFKDTTERKRAEAALHESEQRFKTLAEASFEGIALTDNGIFVDLTEQFANMLACDRNELLGRNVLEFVAPEFRDRAERAHALDEPGPYEFNALRKDGSTFPVEVRARSTLIGGRRLRLTATRDMTAYKAAEEALRRSEERFRLITENMGDLVCQADPEGKYLYTSPSYRRILGYDGNALLGTSVFEQIHPDDRREIMERFRRGFETGEAQEAEYRNTHANGQYLWLRSTANFVYDSEENPLFTVVTTRDVTARREAEAALLESETKFRTLSENSAAAVFITQDDLFVYANATFQDLSGYDEDDLTRLKFWEIAHPDLRQSIRERGYARWRGESEPTRYEAVILTKDGKAKWADVSATLIEYRGRPATLGTGIDISERKQAEQQIKAALEEKEVLLREVHHRVKNNLQAIIYLIDSETDQTRDPQVFQFLKELEERARTMALVYEQLYQSDNLAHIEMVQYLSDLGSNLVQAFGAGRDIPVAVEPGKIWLDVEIGMPCGLIVNELVTNALKHAFPQEKHERGEVRVALHKEDGRYTLRVSDNGVGLPPELRWREARSLGLRLVNLWATHQLGGTISVEGPPGTTFTVTFTERKRREFPNGRG